jgi:hypothetical protein
LFKDLELSKTDAFGYAIEFSLHDFYGNLVEYNQFQYTEKYANGRVKDEMYMLRFGIGTRVEAD